MTRRTRTGSVLEQSVIPSLMHGGYSFQEQIEVGKRLGGGTHRVDLVVTKATVHYLVSLKWQQTSGTAEQKVPFEVLCLLDIVQKPQAIYQKAYVVLGGGGWKLRDFYIRELNTYLPHRPLVEITNLKSFMGLANKGSL